MDYIYFRCIFSIFIVLYVALYFRARRCDLETINVSKWITFILGRPNGRYKISPSILIAHILNLLVFAIGIVAYLVLHNKNAMQIYRYALLVCVWIVVIVDNYLEKKNKLR